MASGGIGQCDGNGPRIEIVERTFVMAAFIKKRLSRRGSCQIAVICRSVWDPVLGPTVLDVGPELTLA
jgi:hypothetical protein